MQSTDLFQEHPENSGKNIIQIQSTSKKLTAEHQSFNKLTKRIDSLQKKISIETEKLESLNALYQKEVYGKVLELGHYKIKLSHLLHAKREKVHLSKLQNEKLDIVIFDLLDDAFSVIEPDEDTKKLYGTYSDEDFDEENKADEDMMKSVISKMFEQEFGLKLDPSLLEGAPNFDKIEADLQRQIIEKEQSQKSRRKTKKQLEKEAKAQQKEELKKKSLRSIYLSLAKLLHPDMEQDENLRIEKEEIMKKVTTAYNDKDMMELLKIEMQWVKSHQQNLENTSVNTIAVYVQLLKDQVQQLEFELDMVYNNPKYAPVLEFKSNNPSIAKMQLMRIAAGYENINQEIAGQIKDLDKSEFATKSIKKCIELYSYLNEPFSQPRW